MSKYKNYDERFTFEGGSGTHAPIIMYGKVVEDYHGSGNEARFYFKDEKYTTVFDEQEVINSYLNGINFCLVSEENSEQPYGNIYEKQYVNEIYGFYYKATGSPDSKPEDLDFRLFVDAIHDGGLIAREEDLELVADTSTETEGGDSQTETGEGGIIVGPGPKG